LSLEPSTLAVGDTLSVQGSGWPANTLILLALADEEGRSGILAAATTSREGTLSAAFAYPASDRWAGLGSRTVVAYSANEDFQAQADVLLTIPELIRPDLAVAETNTPVPTVTPTLEVTETPIPEATETPMPEEDSGWQTFLWDNPDLSGNPVVVRQDEAINFDWDFGSPAPGVPADNFSAQWSRTLFLTGGLYRLTLTVDDGARVFLNGRLVMDEWRMGAARTAQTDLVIPAGVQTFRVDYFEITERAVIRFDWTLLEADEESGGVSTPQAAQATPVAPSLSGDGWVGEYFANRSLAGPPTLVRLDPAIRFDWSEGSPDPSLPVDNFSVRWSRQVFLQGGTYQFNALSDDGMRVFIDGELLLDEWRERAAFPQTVTVDLPAGNYLMVVEYFEGTGRALISFDWILASQGRSAPSNVPPPPPTPTWTPTPVAPLKPVV
jgi:hypothetical protein